MTRPLLSQFEGFSIRRLAGLSGLDMSVNGVVDLTVPNLGGLPATHYSTGVMVVPYAVVSQMAFQTPPVATFELRLVLDSVLWGNIFIDPGTETQSHVMYPDTATLAMVVPTGSLARLFVMTPLNFTLSLDLYGWTI